MDIGWDGLREWVKDFTYTTLTLTVAAVLVFLKNEFGLRLPGFVWAAVPAIVLAVLAVEIVEQHRKRQREKARVATELSYPFTAPDPLVGPAEATAGS